MISCLCKDGEFKYFLKKMNTMCCILFVIFWVLLSFALDPIFISILLLLILPIIVLMIILYFCENKENTLRKIEALKRNQEIISLISK